eukprot:c21029_g5_i4.p2 GENE.c21029_g5_i4~~c21029_g5_i4.p2  ORF type:complete len:188 (+),score=110.35 c21029_g5_i4:153-716(+)
MGCSSSKVTQNNEMPLVSAVPMMYWELDVEDKTMIYGSKKDIMEITKTRSESVYEPISEEPSPVCFAVSRRESSSFSFTKAVFVPSTISVSISSIEFQKSSLPHRSSYGQYQYQYGFGCPEPISFQESQESIEIQVEAETGSLSETRSSSSNEEEELEQEEQEISVVEEEEEQLEEFVAVVVVVEEE